jgi:hypothetical protein
MRTSSSKGPEAKPSPVGRDPAQHRAAIRRERQVPAPRPSVPYQRERDLPRLLPLWPEELQDLTLAGRQALVLRLGAMLRRERQRGIAGSWGYDIARHRQLVIAYRAELQAWQQLLRHATSAEHRARVPVPSQSISRGASPTPSSSPALSEPRHSSAPP